MKWDLVGQVLPLAAIFEFHLIEPAQKSVRDLAQFIIILDGRKCLPGINASDSR